jgi:TonB dependent receptor-like, beta-barrel
LARVRDDFAAFREPFQALFKLQIEAARIKAEELGLTPYDALLDGHELGLRTAFIDPKEWQASQELRLSGVQGPLTWVSSLHYLHIQGAYHGFLVGGIPVDYDVGGQYAQWVNTAGAFGQGDYAVTPALAITLGARITEDRKSLKYTALCNLAPSDCYTYEGAVPNGTYESDRYDDTEWSGRFALRYKFTSDLMGYASVSRGTKGALIEAPLVFAPRNRFH